LLDLWNSKSCRVVSILAMSLYKGIIQFSS